MKHVTAFTTNGACLLVLSVGAAVAANPHPASGVKSGQSGSNHGIACGGTTAGTGVSIASAPGNPSANGSAANAANSPFGSSPPAYAGNPDNPTAPMSMGGKGVGNSATTVSQYDVACFQAP